MGNAHSSIGPSAAERWINCPGSIALSAKCPPQKPSFAAAEGTVAHKIAEELVLGKADEITLMGRVGEVVIEDGHEVTIIEEMIEGARLYRDTIEADRLEFLKANRAAPVHTHCELRVPIEAVDKACFGTLDYGQWQKGHRIIIYDYKFGQGHMVSPRENKQAGLYFIGVEDGPAGTAFDRREIVIVQPRALGSEADRVKRWDVDTKWLKDLRMIARAAVKIGREPNPPLSAGTHCRWCPAQGMCPEFVKKAQSEVQADFSTEAPAVKEGELVEGQIAGLPDARLLNLAQMATILAWEDPLAAFFGQLRMRIQEALERGEAVPGYKLVDGRSNRKWADDTGEVAAAHFAVKFGHRVYAPKKALSVAQMEKLVGKGKIPEEFIIKPPAPKKVARSDDPRPVAMTTAQEDFGPAPAVGRDLSGLNRLLEEKGVAPERAPAPEPALVDPLTDPLADLPAPAAKKREPVWPI